MILVTGGAGFIGSHLCRRLFLEGYAVISLDDYSTGSPDNHCPGVEYRRGHGTEIASIVPETPDVIFHMGEYSRVETSFRHLERLKRSNIRGTAEVFQYWNEKRCKLVYCGSSTKFGDVESPYSFTKARNSEVALRLMANGLRGSVTYFYNAYGPGERPANESGTLIETFRRQRLAGKPLTVVRPGSQRRNFTHVEDIISGLMLAMDRDGEFPIGAAESYSILEVAEMFGGPIELLPERPGNRTDSTIDTSAIRALGWQQRYKLADYINDRLSHQSAVALSA